MLLVVGLLLLIKDWKWMRLKPRNMSVLASWKS